MARHMREDESILMSQIVDASNLYAIIVEELDLLRQLSETTSLFLLYSERP